MANEVKQSHGIAALSRQGGTPCNDYFLWSSTIVYLRILVEELPSPIGPNWPVRNFSMDTQEKVFYILK
jgi:hypothetical protein